MARARFGQTTADLALKTAAGGQVLLDAGAALEFYLSDTGGSPVSDLLNPGLQPIVSYATADDGALSPYFYGPDGVFDLWVQGAGSLERVLLPCWAQDRPSGFTLKGGGVWAASHAYTAGEIYTSPTGATWVAKASYVSGATYDAGSIDTTNSIRLTVDPFTQATADARYSPLSAGYVEMTIWDGADLEVGYDSDVNGRDLKGSGTLDAVQVELDLMPVGGNVTGKLYHWVAATNTETVAATTVITDGTVSATVTGLGLTYANNDKLDWRVDSIDATVTYAGAGAKVRVALNGATFATVPAPVSPTNFRVVSTTSTSVTLGWSPVANASQYVLLKDGKPIKNLGSQVSYIDAGLDPVIDAAGHDYKLIARRFSAVSAATAVVHGTPGSSTGTQYQILPNFGGTGTDGNLDSSKVLVMRGTTAPNPAAQVVAGVLKLIGGNTSASNNVNDRVLLKLLTSDAGGTKPRSAMSLQTLLKPGNASSIWEFYLISSDQNLSGTNATTYLQFQMTVSGLRIGGKFGTTGTFWTPYTGNGGYSTVGSFQNFSDPAYTVNQLTDGNGNPLTRTSASGVSLGATEVSTGTTKYGVRIEALPRAGDGSQIVNVRYGTEAQYGTSGATASSMPILATLTLTAAQAAALGTGYAFVDVLGTNTAGGTAYEVDFSDLDWSTLSAANA